MNYDEDLTREAITNLHRKVDAINSKIAWILAILVSLFFGWVFQFYG